MPMTQDRCFVHSSISLTSLQTEGSTVERQKHKHGGHIHTQPNSKNNKSSNSYSAKPFSRH